MSQVVKAITATDTGDRKLLDSFSPLFQDVFSVKETIQELRHDDVAKVYRIGVTIGAQCMVTENMRDAHVDSLTEAINRTKRSVIEAIFGEFRSEIMQLETAIYNRDFAKAKELLRVLESKMFGVV
jgi:hypothetical protein